MKKLIVVLSIITSLAACTRIGPGYVGIKVSNAGDNRGVDQIPVTTGWVIYNPMLTNVYEWPTFTKTYAWQGGEAFTFNTSNKMTVSVDTNISYSLIASKVPAFYVKFRDDDLDVFTRSFLHNIARDVFVNVGGQYDIDQVMGNSAGFVAAVRAELQKEVSPYGVNIDQFGIVGSPRPPAEVLQAITASAQARQQAITSQNQLATVQAEMAKERAKAETYAANKLTNAEAEAKANQLISNSITPTLVEYQRIQKWDGKLPQMTGGGTPLFQLK